METLSNRAIAETMQRHASECIDGTTIQKVHVDKSLLKEIEKEMTKDHTPGYIIWLKSGENPGFSSIRPTVLPNPDLWKSQLQPPAITASTNDGITAISSEFLPVSATDTAQETILDIDEIVISDSDCDSEDDKEKPSVSSKIFYEREITAEHDVGKKISKLTKNKALARYTAFKRGAIEMQLTADLVLSFPKARVSVHPRKNISIVDATEGFSKSCITDAEVKYYQSINAIDKIFKMQMDRVHDLEARPWNLIDLPNQTEAEKQRIADAKAQMVKRYAEIEAGLRKFLTRKGEDNLDPTHEILAYDGNRNPAEVLFSEDAILNSISMADMNKDMLKQHARLRKIPGKMI